MPETAPPSTWMNRIRFPESTSGRVTVAGVFVAMITLILALGYALSGNGSTGPTAEPAVTPPSFTSTPTTPPEGPVDMAGRAPLTGVATDDDLGHPPLAVKVSNTPDAHPHRGLGDADVVFVEPITGATTRLAAIFHSRLPDEIGPVRSMRPMDAPILGQTGGIIANAGAAPWVRDYIHAEADLDELGTLSVPRGTYRIDSDRVAPNHVFARPDELLALSDRAGPPPPYFSYAFGPAQSTAQKDGTAAASVTVGYGGSSTATWTHDAASERWLRAEEWSEHILENGEQVTADNVIVMHTERDRSFAQADESMTILDVIDASGSLDLFTGDKVVTGRWSKGDVNEPFEFTTNDGTPLLLTPGTTWVECVLDGMTVTIS